MSLSEASLYSWVLIAPVVLIVVIAALVPTLLARKLPETMAALAVNLILSACMLWGLSAVFFGVMYSWQGVPVAVVIAGSLHLMILGAKAGLLWAPIILLVLAVQPQKWRPEL